MAKALESKNRANSTAAFVCAEEGRYVEAPTRYHRLLIAVDAAHLVPPTGAKDLNLALSSEFVLTHVPEMFYQQISPLGLERYSVIARLCEWKSDRFAGHMTLDLHTFFDQVSSDEHMAFGHGDCYAGLLAERTTVAEDYVGLADCGA